MIYGDNLLKRKKGPGELQMKFREDLSVPLKDA